MNDTYTHDINRMAQALACARKMQGNTGDNPCVGCIVEDKNKNIVGVSATGKDGVPHAEISALNQAGSLAEGGTLYVTLEPCCHFGKTSPCVIRIIQSNIRRVVIGCLDTDKRVNGLGIKELLNSKLIVDVGIKAKEVLKHHKGYLYNRSINRPQFILKMALSTDAKIHSNKNNLGRRCIISDETSHLFIHNLRSRFDAIMVGSNTIKYDNPKLTCRINSLNLRNELAKVRVTQVIILDKDLKIFKSHISSNNINVFKQKQHKCIYIAYENCQLNNIYVNIYQSKNKNKSIKFLPVKLNKNLLDLNNLSELIAVNGINDVLVEGGAMLASQLLKHKLLDKCYFIFSPIFFGSNGLPLITSLDIIIDNWSYVPTRHLGKDILIELNAN